jgi:2-desacetyl-2-hydroxyethyl bacteriochlorophyllide A dehydrogenase
VVGSINIRCDACDHRCSGVEHCPDRKAIGIRDAHGAFADCLALPVENLQLVPAHLADTQAVFAEPVAAALRILEQVSIDAGYRVLVIGAGKLGQIIARVMQSTDCDLAVVARYERQLELLELAGIAPITEAGIQPRSYDIAIEATGSPEAVTAAVAAAKPRGTVVLKSTHGEPSKVDLADIVVNEITLIGSRCGPMEKAVALLASGRLDLDPLIDDCLPFSDVSEAFERARQPGAGKILLRP